MDCFDEIIGCEIKDIVTGGGNGSLVLIEIKPNSVLFINCSWKLLKNGDLVVTCNDDTQALTGKIITELNKLKNLKIINIEWVLENDFYLDLENRYRLMVFSDIAVVDDFDNWSLCDKRNNNCVSLTNKFELVHSTYE